LAHTFQSAARKIAIERILYLSMDHQRGEDQENGHGAIRVALVNAVVELGN
jgi:hypothetical protein